MAEEETPNRVEDNTPDLPGFQSSLDSLPPPPEIHFTRPNIGLSQPAATNRQSSANGSSQNGNDASESGSHGAGLAAGTTFVVSILAGLLAGGWLDQHYIHSSTPWGTIVMTVMGAAVGFTNMSRLLSRGGRRKP